MRQSHAASQIYSCWVCHTPSTQLQSLTSRPRQPQSTHTSMLGTPKFEHCTARVTCLWRSHSCHAVAPVLMITLTDQNNSQQYISCRLRLRQPCMHGMGDFAGWLAFMLGGTVLLFLWVVAGGFYHWRKADSEVCSPPKMLLLASVLHGCCTRFQCGFQVLGTRYSASLPPPMLSLAWIACQLQCIQLHQQQR
jgi:hypothetical protein